jgi:hypothetical protein
MVRLCKEGKNVLGEEGQVDRQQWKMPEAAHEERSVRWCVVRCEVVLRWWRRAILDENGGAVPVSECVHPGTGHAKEDGRGGVFMVPMLLSRRGIHRPLTSSRYASRGRWRIV